MKKLAPTLLAGALALAAVAGCSADPSKADPSPTTPPPTTSAPTTSAPTSSAPSVTPSDPYAAAIDVFHQLGLQVWVDSDLVSRWEDGRASFHEALVRDAQLARMPGVVGVKVADELGYDDGLDTPQQVQQFLNATATGLHKLAPHTKILVDMVVLDMGCLPWMSTQIPQTTGCAEQERQSHPATTMSAVDGYLASGTIDALDLSTGLREPSEYSSWGISIDQAQNQAWAEAKRRGWADEVTLQSRHALAFAGDYPGNSGNAWADVQTYVRLPTQDGAQAVQVWTWRQDYGGDIVGLMNPGLQPNPLWQALLAARRSGIFMTTTFTPSQVDHSVEADAQKLAEVFKGVYVAAGTG